MNHQRRWRVAAKVAVAFALLGPAPPVHAVPQPPPQPPVQDIDGQNARNHHRQAPSPPPPAPQPPPAG